MTPSDWPAVARIFAAGIATGHATFESEPPLWERFDADKSAEHRYVAFDRASTVLGWIAAGTVSDRCAYTGVLEHSVYVDPAAHGRGVGAQLLETLRHSAEERGAWTIQCGVFPENTASLTLHTRAGFRTIGTRERLGLMTYGPLAGTWRDVTLLEMRL